ncbi:hypothetical protein [Bradyrhizobium sp. BR 10289]|uniref:hypothetical protein n=1 Tax=Bradyrhizobium sp. BR 10289 TaxID=2749993 RepID=UPI001C650AB9|nr:hypothetical protein [Bradyrhizobium sp. BR 10289]MBW7968607.1 hypothetical protein [Bradyrhizobium sp. BR 10289]
MGREVRTYKAGDPLPADWFAVVKCDPRFGVDAIVIRTPGRIEMRPARTAVRAPMSCLIELVGPHETGSYYEPVEPELLESREPFSGGGA